MSDVSILTKPSSEAGELADCYIVDPPQTLPEEIFDISELLETPEPLVTPDRYVLKKHDLAGVAHQLAVINRSVEKVEDDRVNKKPPKKKKKDENDLEDEKTCKDAPKKKKQKKAATKDAVKTAPPPALGAAPSSTPPLPSSIPPPVDRPREPERCVSPLIGLTHGSWPKQRHNDPNPQPDRVFYCKRERESLICVLYTQNVFFSTFFV